MHDSQLLEEYVTRNSETAFQSLVSRYLNLVHSTALRQVRNASLAEEVAQAVFILLARKAARLRNTRNLVLGGWLYRTTRFVAARAVRGEMRRQRREQEAFEMQQTTSADETWRRIAPVLDEGIEQLDPADRNAVILRFFQDEPLQKVGDALGISEEAARKRVSRSLEKLRAFFNRRGFTLSATLLAAALAGHRADAAPASLAAVISAKALSHAASSAAALPALVAETLAAWKWAVLKMSAGLATAATVAVIVAVHFWPVPAVTTVVSPAAKTVPNAVPVARKEAASTKPAADKSWTLPFQAVDAETGKGIAKARVLVQSVGDMKQAMSNPQQIDVQTNLMTDAEGRCEIGIPYLNPLLLCVGVVADGYEEWCIVGADTKPLPNPCVVKVPRGSSIGGVVQDESGQPVAGAGIQVTFYGTGDASSREFQRERPGIPSDDNVATTDSAGRWTFASAPTNGDFQIAVNHPDFPKAGFQNDDDPHFGSSGTPLKLADLHAGKAVLVLKAGLTLRGIVSDENGFNLAGAKVGSGMFFPEDHTVDTMSDGSFVLRALSPGENFITITANGFAPQRIPVEMSSNASPLAVRLKPGGVLRLRVLDNTGLPLSQARVSLEGWQGRNTLMWNGLTDDGGRIVWSSAPLEPVTFSVLKEGYFSSRQDSLTADGQEHTITLRPQLTVSGRVTDSKTKQPIATFKAVPDPNRDETAYGTNGHFQLTFTEFSQPLVVRIEAEGYQAATSPPLDPNVTNLTCDFELKREASEDAIQGVVLLPDGSAAAGAEVALCGEKPVEMARARFTKSDGSVTTQTDASGHFSFKAGLAARAVLAVHQRGFASLPITPASSSLSIQLQAWGRIEGVLRLSTQPNSGQPIVLSAPPQPGLEDTLHLSLGAYMTKTDQQGKFVFDQAPPGQFNLYLAVLNVAYSHQTPVEIQPGATAVVQIGGTGAILSGHLALSKPGQAIDWSKQLFMAILQTRIPYPPGADGLARAQWYQTYKETEEGRARIRSMRVFPLVVQADGAFTVDDVPPGDYVLRGNLSDVKVNLSEGVMGHIIGSFLQDVTVPEPADNQTSPNTDLGVVTVTSQGP